MDTNERITRIEECYNYLAKSLDKIDINLENLTDEVRSHNKVIERTHFVENEIKILKDSLIQVETCIERHGQQLIGHQSKDEGESSYREKLMLGITFLSLIVMGITLIITL